MTKQTRRQVTSFILILLTAFSAVYGGNEQQKQKDITFIGEAGQAVEGIRCNTPTPTEAEALGVHDQVSRWLANRPAGATEATTVIPVAFHILRSNSGAFDVTDQACQDQIDVMNVGFANTNFQFVLSSIDRTNNTTWSSGSQEQQFKQALAIDPATTLNFYIGNLGGGLLGWAYFPTSFPEDHFMHGVVVLYSSLPGGSAFPYDEGDTGTHEVGHYLGLYHTFQGGCGPNGDFVADTEPEAQPTFGCPANKSSCGSPDPIHNFMDYSDDACMFEFTQGQSDRMDAQVALFKPTLLQGGGGPVVDCSIQLNNNSGNGSFNYRMVFTNTTGSTQNTELWGEVTGPNGYFDLVFTKAKNFGPNSTKIKTRSYSIPAGSPAGDYTFTLYTGERGGVIDDSDSQVYTKNGSNSVSFSPNNAQSLKTAPTTLALDQNYPNPFNPSTTISYGLPAETEVTLKIYNSLGQEIATLVNGAQAAGYHNASWDGKDAAGNVVAAGIYLYRIKAGDIALSGRMMFAK